MFLTVSEPEIKDERSSETEKTYLANASRRALNMTSRARVALTTAATGILTSIWVSDPMPTGTVWAIDVHVMCRTVAGPAGRCRYDFSGLFYRDPAGVATQQGTSASISAPIESVIAANAQFTVIGNTIAVQVLDDGISTFHWDLLVDVREVA